MRVMVIVKANAESEAGALPSPELVEAMGAYNNQLISAGVMLDGAGLKASANGARVSIRNGQAIVTDGPFTETKELIAGYWLWQVASLQEAIDWARKAPTDGDQEFNLELRPFFEPEDFAEVSTPELIAQEQGWRDEQAKAAPKATGLEPHMETARHLLRGDAPPDGRNVPSGSRSPLRGTESAANNPGS